MKTENEFNAALSKKFRALQPSVFSIKASDKVTVGISDFLLFGRGGAVGLETKLIREWPSERALLLSHPFSGTQLTFMESLVLSGNKAYGLVAVAECKHMYLISYNDIPATGNWKTHAFKSDVVDRTITQVNWLDVGLIIHILEGL